VALCLRGTARRGPSLGETPMMTSGTEARATILMVEDEPLISDIVAEALTEEGFQVEAVSNGEDALRLLRAGIRFDILFTDVDLPGDMDGAALARRVRELNPGMPVIYTSGRRAIIESITPVDRSMFLPKPYNPYEIGRLVEHLVATNAQPGIGSRGQDRASPAYGASSLVPAAVSRDCGFGSAADGRFALV
jgi:DNA-binding response OmpR family regulator